MPSNRSVLIQDIEALLESLPQPLKVGTCKYMEMGGWAYIYWDVDLDRAEGGKSLRIETCTTDPYLRAFDVVVHFCRGVEGAYAEDRQLALWYSPSQGGWYTLNTMLRGTLQEWFGAELAAYRVQL